MAKFDAGKAVEPLDYDFTACGGEKGTIPEPNEEILAEFLSTVSNLTENIAKQVSDVPDDATPEQMFEIIGKLKTSDVLAPMYAYFADACAKLCQGKPGVDQIEKLPMRVRSAFFLWLLEEVRPEIFGAATTQTRPNLRAVSGA